MRIILIVEFSFASALSFLRAWRQRIVTSAEGIEYYAPALYRIRTRWENIQRVGATPRFGFGRVEGLVLREPGFQGPGWLLYLPWIKAQAHFIPLGQYFESWHCGRLGQAIHRYAPHLLELQPSRQALPPRAVQVSSYRTPLRWLTALMGGLGFMGLGMLVIYTVLEPDDRSVTARWIAGLLFVILAWVIGLVFRLSRQMYLVASAEGVEYHQPGYSIQTTWDNIERIGPVPLGLIKALQTEGLILRQPSLRVSKRLGSPVGPLRAGTFIPLQEYPLWRNQALGRYIQQYAPHLLTHTNIGQGA